MSVTASFQPEHLAAEPGEITSLTLHLQNNDVDERTVTLSASGDLVGQTVLSTGTVRLDAGEHLEVPVVIDANGDLQRGRHSCVVDVAADDQTISVSAQIEIGGDTPTWAAVLTPVRSSGSQRGKHKLRIDNPGASRLILGLTPSTESEIDVELAAPTVTVEAVSSAQIALGVYPHHRYWTGDRTEHPFRITATGDHEHIVVDGTYEQKPRVARWVGPALAGMIGSLLLGLLAWYTLIEPEVRDIAVEEAAALDAAQQAALDQQVAEIQAAADEAASLPLGEPTDLRMEVSASPSTSSSVAFDFDQDGSGRTLSISDVIFQNPTGAIGRLELLRDGEVLLDQEMANFRDLDFHLVAPFQVESQSTIALRVTCDTPGPGTDECEASATIAGFVDDA